MVPMFTARWRELTSEAQGDSGILRLGVYLTIRLRHPTKITPHRARTRQVLTSWRVDAPRYIPSSTRFDDQYWRFLWSARISTAHSAFLTTSTRPTFRWLIKD